MVWDAAEPSAGFSTGKPWLPVKPPQAAKAVAGQERDPDSVLALYRAMLRLRRDTEALRTGRTRFFDVAEPVLAFTRGGTMLCVFNLSPKKHEVVLKGGGAMALSQGAEHKGERLALRPNGFAIMAASEKTKVADVAAKPRKKRAK